MEEQTQEKQTKILITGATGFVGTHLTQALLDAGYSNVIGTCNSAPRDSVLPKDRYVQVDLTDQEQTNTVLATVKPDWIFHLAATAAVGASYVKAKETLQNNIGLQISVLNAIAQSAPQARVLVIGSADAYGVSEPGEIPIRENHPFRPVNPYAVSKAAQELLAYSFMKSHHLNIIRVRPFNHIGEGQSPEFAIPAFAKQIVAIERGKQEKLLVGSLDAIRDFSDVKDVVRAYILLMEKGIVGEVYNIGSGKGIRVQQILDMLVSLAQKPIPVETDPSRVRPVDIPELVCDASKIRALGWIPTITLEETVARTIQWWRSRE